MASKDARELGTRSAVVQRDMDTNGRNAGGSSRKQPSWLNPPVRPMAFSTACGYMHASRHGSLASLPICHRRRRGAHHVLFWMRRQVCRAKCSTGVLAFQAKAALMTRQAPRQAPRYKTSLRCMRLLVRATGHRNTYDDGWMHDNGFGHMEKLSHVSAMNLLGFLPTPVPRKVSLHSQVQIRVRIMDKASRA